MKLLVYHPSLRCPRAVATLLERRLRALAARIRIEQADVRFAVGHEAAAPIRAAIRLRVPGTDLHASASAPTIGVATARALSLLERQVRGRLARRVARRRSHLPHASAHLGAVPAE